MPADLPPALTQVQARRHDRETPSGKPERCQVATEAALLLDIAGHGRFKLMCTPLDLEALAVGYTFSEGLIHDREGISEIHFHRQPLGFRLVLGVPAPRATDTVLTASAGRYGANNQERLLSGDVSVPDTLRVRALLLPELASRLREGQHLFSRSGGTHAVALFTADGHRVSMAEDIGRHNAMDKAIGQCLLAGRSPAGLLAMLSGRVSTEMVAKCVGAGIELLAAVSAPSSLALQAARRGGLTVCGFVRGSRATVFTHPHRVT